ncbi:uncharacterized protein DS421_4g119740 [Arachis hypogaea]|nr:uncharacterized protein DS421_4g119740 [Arachis hypogaea]
MRKPRRHHYEEAASRRAWFVSLIVAKPPPLTAAVFPWDRKEETQTMKEQEKVAVSSVGVARRSGDRRRELKGVSPISLFSCMDEQWTEKERTVALLKRRTNEAGFWKHLLPLGWQRAGRGGFSLYPTDKPLFYGLSCAQLSGFYQILPTFIHVISMLYIYLPDLIL